MASKQGMAKPPQPSAPPQQQGDNEEAKAAAADILWGLLGYKHSVSVVRESGAIPLLLDLLQGGGEDAREKALGAIVQMSYKEADRKALAEAGAIPLLIGLLRSESDELNDNAIEALLNFSEDPLMSESVLDVFGDPLFQVVRNRLVRFRASDEHMHDGTSLAHPKGTANLLKKYSQFVSFPVQFTPVNRRLRLIRSRVRLKMKVTRLSKLRTES